jgi:hypothetical protein
MRTLTDHITNPCNEAIRLEVIDEPGQGGACHHYRVTLPPKKTGDKAFDTFQGNAGDTLDVLFQNGPIKEVGTNGVTQEVLLAICIDRLRSFQAGPYACRENAVALTKMEESLMWLQKRTRAREARGVEGTHQK